jgi:hypothetical protein
MLNRKFVKWLFIATLTLTMLLKFNEVFSQQPPKAGYSVNASMRTARPVQPVTLISVAGQKSVPLKTVITAAGQVNVAYDDKGNCNSEINGSEKAICSVPSIFSTTVFSGAAQWQYSTNGSNFTDLVGATSQSITVSFNGTGNYAIRLKNITANCNVIYSNEIPVAVSDPVSGSSLSDAINITTFPFSGIYSSTCFPSSFNQAESQQTPAVFFRIKTPAEAKRITISTCSPKSEFDTFLYLLDEAGDILTSNDDCNGCAYGVSEFKHLSQVEKYHVESNAVYFIVVQGYYYAAPKAGLFGLNIDVDVNNEEQTPAPVAEVNAGADRELCNLFAAQLSASYPSAGQTGKWTLLSGTGIIANVTDAHSLVRGLSTTAPNVFQWTVTTANGTVSDEVCIKVYTEHPANNVSVTGPQYGCTGDTLAFKTDLRASSLKWSVRPAGEIISGQGTADATVIFQPYTTAGLHACVQGSNACGTNITKCATIRNRIDKPVILSRHEIKDQDAILFSINSIPGVLHYKWIAGEGVIINGKPSPCITTDTSVTVISTANNTSQQLSVAAFAGCEYGPAAMVNLSHEANTLKTDGPDSFHLNLKVYPDISSHTLTVTFNSIENGEWIYKISDKSGNLISNGIIETKAGNNMKVLSLLPSVNGELVFELKNNDHVHKLNIALFDEH